MKRAHWLPKLDILGRMDGATCPDDSMIWGLGKVQILRMAGATRSPKASLIYFLSIHTTKSMYHKLGNFKLGLVELHLWDTAIARRHLDSLIEPNPTMMLYSINGGEVGNVKSIEKPTNRRFCSSIMNLVLTQYLVQKRSTMGNFVLQTAFRPNFARRVVMTSLDNLNFWLRDFWIGKMKLYF